MTTLAGIQGNGWCVIGADSRVVDDNTIVELPKNAGKIFRKNGYIVAVAGDFRVAQIAQYSFEFPKLQTFSSIEATDKFFTTELIPMWKAEYEDLNYTVDKDLGSVALVAVGTTIYTLDADWTWVRDRRGIYAGGTGASYVLGALSAYAKAKNVDDAISQIKTAIKIASQYDSNTAEPAIVYGQADK